MDTTLQCSDVSCGARSFPVVNGIPVLINEQSSIFDIDNYVQQGTTFWKSSADKTEFIRQRLIPEIGRNIRAKGNYEKFEEMLLAANPEPVVLIIGGSRVGEGIQSLLDNPKVTFIESDISFGPRTSLITDAHDLPFAEGALDGVIVQAVLEHVIDPFRCVEEIHRVLKPGGLVYAETPFMQHVHAGRFDFMRFSALAHRRLFRDFEEIWSGAVCGPGMTLAWSYQFFLLSFVKGGALRAATKVFARLTSFWLKYFDYFLINKPAAEDAASACGFLGKKGTTRLSDRDLIKLYKGGQ